METFFALIIVQFSSGVTVGAVQAFPTLLQCRIAIGKASDAVHSGDDDGNVLDVGCDKSAQVIRDRLLAQNCEFFEEHGVGKFAYICKP